MDDSAAIPMTASHQAARPTDRLGELFDRHHRRLYNLALRMTQRVASAEDLVQDTYLRAARRLRTVPADESGEEAWLVRVLINLARDGYRRRSVRAAARRHFTVATPASTDPSSAEVARHTLRRALRSLPPRRRAIVVLRELEGLPTSAVAELLGLEAVTVRWHLARGRAELALAIEGPADRESDR